jgi:hypothetical protein
MNNNKGKNKMATINKNENYKNPLINIGEYRSDHYENNLNIHVQGASYECIMCGKGIKHTSKHHQIISGGGHEMNLIHKDEWDYAESKENTDGGFMGAWDIGSECVKKLKHIPNIKNYIRKPTK